ncbi:DUF126 domain-containing protein [Cloacibacillus sp. An23]|uniref:aconitase X swivel domain-containing protein n=1 Tax=Cloacibacillus sp. An23 TaxID=1965591 RepID=UPI000B3833A3|nr:DUF126 domain-containing protein [Cloacibacillus sp. An23]OUO94406.1 hypothetical protein B5F39_04060 [Cloacibacillus sp. An23]
MGTHVFSCRKIAAGKAEGEILISKDDICFYLTDPESGKIIEEGHALDGVDISGKILVFPAGKGSSSVNLDGLYQLMTHGKCPKAMIVEYADAILVTCAILMRIPTVDRVPAGFYELIRDGARCRVDAGGGEVTLL